MKINLFKVLLFTFLVSVITTTVSYFVMVLMFNDCLQILEEGKVFFWVSFGIVFAIIFFVFLYMVSYFLPLFYVQKKQILEKTATELFWRFMPLTTLIASAFAFLAMLIGSSTLKTDGMAWIIFWLFYILSYSAMTAFVYRVKRQ